jgi:hypothetical protein
MTAVLDIPAFEVDEAEGPAETRLPFELYLEIDAQDMPDARDVLEHIAACLRDDAREIRLVSYGVRVATPSNGA